MTTGMIQKQTIGTLWKKKDYKFSNIRLNKNGKKNN